MLRLFGLNGLPGRWALKGRIEGHSDDPLRNEGSERVENVVTEGEALADRIWRQVEHGIDKTCCHS